MKTLVIVAHPHLDQSKVNKAWVERLKQEASITVHDLYA
ncbi:general stress protein, partial [Mesorhizobium sp. M00.F.Ca.ET.186.01.1.1]